MRNRAEYWRSSKEAETRDLLPTIKEDPEAPERLWAIKTLFRLGQFEQLQKLIPKSELLKLLPQLQLAGNEQETFQKQVETWK